MEKSEKISFPQASKPFTSFYYDIKRYNQTLLKETQRVNWWERQSCLLRCSSNFIFHHSLLFDFWIFINFFQVKIFATNARFWSSQSPQPLDILIIGSLTSFPCLQKHFSYCVKSLSDFQIHQPSLPQFHPLHRLN